MADTGSGKARRFYQNPVLRDREWEHATQPPWALMIAVVAIVAVGFFAGVYADKPFNILGWIVGIGAIVVFIVLGRRRRERARHDLRRAHGQEV